MQIRQANKSDIPTIHRFICELASYEKLFHEVVATKEILEETLFGQQRSAEVILAFEDKTPIGFALFFHNFSTFLGRPGLYLEDIYVIPAARHKGVGKQLLSYLAQVALERQCARLEWSVLDWNEPAIKFYRSINAEAMDGWTVYRLTGKALQHLARDC